MNDETDLHGEGMTEAKIIRESLSCPSGERPRESESPASAFAVAGGWGAWMREAWDAEAPACVRCGVAMRLNDGCEWSDSPELNLCHPCALTVLEDMRPNNGDVERRGL